MRKKVFKLLAAILCAATIVQSIPVFAYGTDSDVIDSEFSEKVNSEKLDASNDDVLETSDQSVSYILGEIEEERTENTKVFRMNDGSYTAAVYPVQVHYEKDGELREIDYSFEAVERDGTVYYETKDGPVTVSVPKIMDEGAEVTYIAGDNKILFSLNTVKSTELEYSQTEKSTERIEVLKEAIGKEMLTNEAFEEQFKKKKAQVEADISIDEAATELQDIMMTAYNALSEVQYTSVMDGVDLRYNISGTLLKEEIILNSANAELKSFAFDLDPGNLTPVLNEDGSVSLNDSEGVEQLAIAAPFMYDSVGAESADIKVTLESKETGGYTYTLIPDEKWLASDDRSYPVVIDPPITDSSFSTVKDTTAVFASSAGSLNNTGEEAYLKVGKRYDSVSKTAPEVQAMLYSPLPAVLNSTTNIVHAYLNLYGYRQSLSTCKKDMQINAYTITSDWNTSDIYENSVLCLGSNGRSDYSNVLDYVYYNDTVSTDGKLYSFEITEAAQQWLNGDKPNYGIALRAVGLGSEECFARFFDSTNRQTSQACPKFVYVYRDSKGIEDYWSFTSVQAGRTGVVSVNNYNGNFVTVHDLVSSTGNNMPVSVSLIYSANSPNLTDSGELGQWRTNYHMRITKCNLSFENIRYRFCYTDSDGTNHYLKEDGNKYRDEDGLGLVLTTGNINTDGYSYLIEAKDHTLYYFDYYGRLIKILDTNGNSNIVTYQLYNSSTDIRINKISERTAMSSTVRETVFTYKNDGDVVITSPEGNYVELDFDGTSNKKLIGIKYEDGVNVSLSYSGSNNYPVKITDGNGHETNIGYGSKNKVSYISWGTSSVISTRYSFTYLYNATKVTDYKGRASTLQFNGFGQTVSTVDHTSSVGQSYKFGAPGGTDDGYENKLLLTSKSLYASENRMTDGGFSFSNVPSKYSVHTDGASNISKTFDSYGNTSTGSMRLTKNAASSGNTFIAQNITGLTVGKYTLSAYVSTNGVKLNGSGVSMTINVADDSYRTGSNSERITYTQSGEWMRIQTTVDVESGDKYINAGIYIPKDTYGTVYIDDIQLEHNVSGGAGSFNQLSNSFMPEANGKISGWDGGNNFTRSFKDASAPSGLKYVANTNGDPAGERSLSQTVNISGKKNDVFAMGAWAKADSVPLSSDVDKKKGAPKFSLELTFYNGTSKVGDSQTVDFNSGITEWQFVSDKVIAPGNYTSIKYSFLYSYNTGNASLATPFLYKESYGQSYVYDSNGNVTSVVDVAETEATFAYQNNVLSTSISPTGSRYMYATDDVTYNTSYAVSNAGQRIGFEYNKSGDATKMLMQDMKLITELSTAQPTDCYIVNAKSGRALIPISSAAGSVVYSGELTLENQNATWKTTSRGNNSYYITNAQSSNYLTVASSQAGKASSAIKQLGSGDAPSFNIRFTPNGDGTFRISSEKSSWAKYLYENSDDTYQKGSGYYNLYLGDYDESKPEYKWYIVSAAESNTLKMSSSAQYNEDGNYLTSSTDAVGGTTAYEYNTKGLLSKSTDPMGNSTSYSYDSMGRTTSVTNGTSNVGYTYANDLLTQISVGNGSLLYNFVYDNLGRKRSVNVGNANGSRALATYTYNNNLMTKQTYGNGTEYISFQYDNLDRLIKKSYNGSSNNYISYSYDPNGNLYSVKDGSAALRTSFEYDLAGRISGIAVSDLNTLEMRAYESVRYNDGKGTLKSMSRSMFDTDNTKLSDITYGYTYGDALKGEDPSALYKLSVADLVLTNEYDGLGRLKTKNASHGETDLGTESYTYMANPNDSSYTTTLINSMTDLTGNEHTYTYDANGNILSDTYKGKTTSYEYDEQNRMTLYKDEAFGFAFEYTYDDRGNILEKKEYMLPDMTEPHNTFVYEYEDETWGDLLTSYDGMEITYDELGNPQNTMFGDDLRWENRRLVSGFGNEYKYNADGLRVSKNNSKKSTEYYIVDGTYIGEVTQIGNQKFVITYLYGTDGIAGIDINGTPYYFVKNLQGDVTGILDANGNVVGTYQYDAYGVITAIYNKYGYNILYRGGYETDVISLNPFRYRGYMFDSEAELYYLHSRYYDPWTGRFLNADVMVSTGQGFDGNNMFAYCINNPVMYKDPAGNRSVEAIEAGIKYLEERIAYVRSVLVSDDLNPYHYNAKTICGLKHWLKDLQAELEEEKARKAHPIGGSDTGKTYYNHGNARDFAAPAGTPILATMGGKIVNVCMNYSNSQTWNPLTLTGDASVSTGDATYGNYIDIVTWDGTILRYAHMMQESINISYVGKTVNAGDLIGLVGQTGAATGTHVHLQSLGGDVDNYYYHY